MAAEGVAGEQVAVAAEAAEDDVVAGHRDGRIDEVDEPDADQCRDLQIRGQPWHQRRQEVDVAVAAADHPAMLSAVAVPPRPLASASPASTSLPSSDRMMSLPASPAPIALELGRAHV